jgi:hypothetical protein
MAITINKYDNFLLGQMNGSPNSVIDFDTDDIRVSLHSNSYVPNAAAHDFYDDVSFEVSGSNYTAGGTSLSSVTLTLASGVVKFDASDVTWLQSGSGFTNARYAVIRRYNATAGNSRLICYIDFGADIGNTVADLVLVWNSAGIINWQ